MSINRKPKFDSAIPSNEVSPALADALAKAQAQSPTCEQVAQLVARVEKLGRGRTVIATSRHLKAVDVAAVIAAAAVCIAFAVTSLIPRSTRGLADRQILVGEKLPVHSAVTQSLLIDVGFHLIDDDFQTADSRLSQAEEEIGLAEVLQDIREALALYPSPEH